MIGEAAARVEALEAEITELKRRLGMNSGNSSSSPSKDSIAVKAKRRVDLSSRVRSKDRKPGGQAGHQGSGLEPATKSDRTEVVVEPPDQCRRCTVDLTGAPEGEPGWSQTWDIPPIELKKVHYLLPTRICGNCGTSTTAAPPWGQARTVSYGPTVNAAATLLSSEGNVPIERTARLMEMLLGTPVSTGFVARAMARLSNRLEAAQFDVAMETALRAEKVLCADETPVNVLRKDTDEHGRPIPGAPHAVVVRTPDARLIQYNAMTSRSSASLASLKALIGWAGILVRDDYAGWYQLDPQLTAVQQCCIHLIRHCKGVVELGAAEQAWAWNVIEVLREANVAVTKARDSGRDHLDPAVIAALRQRFDEAVDTGITVNQNRSWHKGRHPGYRLAKRLNQKADQVWLFTTDFDVPWTNNASEQAIRGPKRHQAVSGYWHTTSTLAAYLRVRSYMVSAAGHGIRAIDAIHDAIAGTPWLPAPVT